MKVTVVGASGAMGHRLAAELAAAGTTVVPAHRGVGVDAYRATGLETAFAGADVVVDCVNLTTRRASTAIDFYGTVAANVATAARTAGVGRVVCLSIVNAARPEVNAKFGYYQGKARQEEVYTTELGSSVTLFRTTQWFELAQTLLDAMSFGPIAAIPQMLTRPLAAADGARLLSETVLTGDQGVVEVAGPEQVDLVEVARAIAARRGAPRWVAGLPVGGAAMRSGALEPNGEHLTTKTTLKQWLDNADLANSEAKR